MTSEVTINLFADDHTLMADVRVPVEPRQVGGAVNLISLEAATLSVSAPGHPAVLEVQVLLGGVIPFNAPMPCPAGMLPRAMENGDSLTIPSGHNLLRVEVLDRYSVRPGDYE